MEDWEFDDANPEDWEHMRLDKPKTFVWKLKVSFGAIKFSVIVKVYIETSSPFSKIYGKSKLYITQRIMYIYIMTMGGSIFQLIVIYVFIHVYKL